MRIGIYGGTYNPPHLGHFRAAQYACSALQLDKLLMIPTNISPHKQLPEGSPSPQQRLEMVRLGAGEFEHLEASDIELRRRAPASPGRPWRSCVSSTPMPSCFC